MATIRDLFVEIGLKVDDEPLKRFDRGIRALESNLGLLRKALFGVAGAFTGVGFVLFQAAKFEQTKIAFEVLIGSAEKADKVLADLLETARTTPFLIPEILQTAQQLIALGTPVEGLIKEIRMLGNTAAGANKPIFLIADAFSKARATGFLMGEVFRQFRRQGIPITEELEKITGKTGLELRKMGAATEITFELLQKAFEAMTGPTGRFFKLMARQALTFLGIWNNIKDSIFIASIAIGEGLLPQGKKFLNQIFDFLQVNRKIIALKGKKFLQEIGKGLLFVLKIIRDMAISIKTIADAFGGLGNVIKGVSVLLLTMFGISTLSAIGNIGLAVGTLAKTFLFMGNTAAIATIKATAFPLVIGVAILALIIILEDILSYFAGKRTLTGPLLDAFEKKYPEAFEKTKNALRTVNEAFEKTWQFIKDFIKDIEKDIKRLTPLLISAFFIDTDRLSTDLDKATKAFRKFVDDITKLPFIGDFFRILEVELGKAWKELKPDLTPEQIKQAFQFGALAVIPRLFPAGVPSNVFGLPGEGLTPALAPAHTAPSINNLGSNVSFNGDVIVNVAAGDGSPEAIGEAVGVAVEEKFGDIFQQAGVATRTRITR